MSKTEIITTISYRSLMNKSKSDLADMVLWYADNHTAELKRFAEEVKDTVRITTYVDLVDDIDTILERFIGKESSE